MANPLGLDSPLADIPRAGPRDVARLRRLGLERVSDLLLALPYALDAYGQPVTVRQAAAQPQATVVAAVVTISGRRARYRSLRLVEALFEDGEGVRFRVVWFNQPHLARVLHRGDRVALAGSVRPAQRGAGLEMQNPHHELVGEGGPSRVGGLMPRYHLTAGLTSARVSALVEPCLPLAGLLPDVIPEDVRRRHALLPVAEAVRAGHRPASESEFAAAGRRMVFAELLELQATFLRARLGLEQERATPVPYRQDVIDTFKGGLGFELTRAQRRAAWDVFQDMALDVPMNRLLNGDVGAGKTAVAAAAVAMAHAAGLQSVVMAPTEILARQHLLRFREHLEESFPGLRVELLVSGLPAPERRRVRMAAASGHCALLVGTHALIEDEVELLALGLAVVDEQHRFGTAQRERLRAKAGAGRPHFLAMTATPIPRSLALALYGEMALSVLDELPPGRTPVATDVVPPEQRERAYAAVRSAVDAGHQAFVICPLVEESESLAVRAATVEFERLRDHVFPDLRLALVHGRMRDKDAVMRSFRDGESDVLVATPVIEVGVDVPNATVMLVEGADRFGLAQLHQFRGRVGRASHASRCLLLADDPTEASLHRLELVARVHDGFRLAEEDMRLRGAGELMGSRQHGMSDLAMRALLEPELLSEVREEAERLLETDPALASAPDLAAAVDARLARTSIS